jgi:hypothetical protein
MWIATKGGRFASIVVDKREPKKLAVRFRNLEDVLYGCDVMGIASSEIVHTPGMNADYEYRLIVSWRRARRYINSGFAQINYRNFKATIGNDGELDSRRHSAFMAAWTAFNRLQRPGRYGSRWGTDDLAPYGFQDGDDPVAEMNEDAESKLSHWDNATKKWIH